MPYGRHVQSQEQFGPAGMRISMPGKTVVFRGEARFDSRARRHVGKKVRRVQWE